ncbi:hypothetical protein HCN44_002165 [Aphidius gifuensis]|uniref:SET domain-containing protein n=1 Tax=Aphidius gifuensis TaxID=684658 RepID=A0A834Y2I3_APHGI|nr:hypothetical protein HCN44_002165 [Aphidius gifuensis]
MDQTNPSDQMDMEIDLSPAEWLEKIIQIEEEERAIPRYRLKNQFERYDLSCYGNKVRNNYVPFSGCHHELYCPVTYDCDDKDDDEYYDSKDGDDDFGAFRNFNIYMKSSVMILDEEYKIQTVFHGIYPPVCFFNHGCHSTLASSVQGDTLIMTTANLIKKGEQIFYNYGPHYKNEILDERQIELKEYYYFECKCLACVGKWPINFSKLSSLKKELEDQHYLDLMVKLIKVNDKFIWATDSIVKFGKRHSKVPDVSLAINDMIKLIDKSSTRYGKHSKQTLFIVNKFEKFLSNLNSPYVRLQ